MSKKFKSKLLKIILKVSTVAIKLYQNFNTTLIKVILEVIINL